MARASSAEETVISDSLMLFWENLPASLDNTSKCSPVAFSNQQDKNQGNRLAVRCVKSDGFARADERARRLLHAGMTAVRDGNALPQTGRTEFFTGKKTFENISMGQ